MSQPNVAELHRVNRCVESVGHPPRQRVVIVVATDQNFSSGQLRVDVLPTFGFADEYVAEMDDAVFRLDDPPPIPNDAFGKIRRPVAIGCDLSVIEMRIRDQINLHLSSREEGVRSNFHKGPVFGGLFQNLSLEPAARCDRVKVGVIQRTGSRIGIADDYQRSVDQ